MKIIPLADPRSVIDLRLGELDAFDCPFCVAKKTVSPDLVAVALVSHEAIHLPRGADRRLIDHVQEGLYPQFQAIGLGKLKEVQVVDLAALRHAVSQRMRVSAELFPYKDGSEDLNPMRFVDVWRGLQGEVFSALIVVTAGAVPGTRAGFQLPNSETKAPPGDVIEILKYRFLRALSELTLSFQTLSYRKVLLEELLFRLIDTSPVLAFAKDEAVQRLDHLRQAIQESDPEEKIWPLWFKFEALQASVCRRLGLKNSYQGNWATLFLKAQWVAGFDHDAAEAVTKLKLSSTRIRDTISQEAAWDAIGMLVGSLANSRMEPGDLDSQLERVKKASDQFGYPGLFDQVIRNMVIRRSREGSDEPEESPEEVVKLITRLSARQPELPVGALLEVVVKQYSWASNPDMLDQLVALLLPTILDVPLQRASLLGWYGEYMKNLGQPDRALSLIGSQPAPWEARLPTSMLRALWTERSNALRLVGAKDDALRVALQVLDITATDAENDETAKPDLAVAWLNVGILQRDVGQSTKAIDALRKSISMSPAPLRWQPLESLALTLISVGRYGEAADLLAEARQVVGGIRSRDHRVALLASEAGARWNAGQRERAAELIDEIKSVDELGARSLAQFASAFAAVAGTRIATAEIRERATALVDRLAITAEAAETSGNLHSAEALLRAAGLVAMTFHLSSENEFWIRNAEVAQAAKSVLHPVTAIELVRIAALEQRDVVKAIEKFQESLVQEVPDVLPNPQSLEVFEPLDHHFRRLNETLFESGYPPRALQFIAGLRRNAYRRATRLRLLGQSERDSIHASLMAGPDDCIEMVAAGLPPFSVLEWIDIEGGVLALVSHITHEEALVGIVPRPDELDLFGAAERIGARTTGWRAGREGEPFDIPEWESFTKWIRRTIDGMSPEGEHVVVIDHAQLSSLPFHIALAEDRTVSYASDWPAVVVAARASLSRPAVKQLGLAFVPRSNETTAVIDGFRASVARTEALAIELGVKLSQAVGACADEVAVGKLLGESDLVKILCHGQISRDHADVGLLVAHENRLPPGNSFAAAMRGAEAHRVGWQQLSRIEKSPAVVFMGVCSGGSVQIHGLDERISVLSSLTDAGTNSVIAPRWKIDVALALPILDDCIAMYSSGAPLTLAVQGSASSAIRRGVPAWQARAFVVEGGWL